MKFCGLTAVMLLAFGSEAIAQTSFWNDSITPRTPTVNDNSVTLGLRFYSDVPGTITGIRFYKGSTNTGTHVGALWASDGTNLTTITFSGETASGWQKATLTSPVKITANTVYIVSYLAPRGGYSCDQNYSWSTLNAGPLHTSGSSPGIFAYGSTTSFPNDTWNGSNYYVDVVFSPTSSTTYTISGRVSGTTGAQLTLSGTSSATVNTDLAGNYTFSNLSNGSYVVAPSQPGYTFSPTTQSATISGASATGKNFTATAVPPTTSRNVSLSWTASVTPNIKGYNIYRTATSGGSYTKLNSTPVTTTNYLDSGVVSGRTYYYVATTLDINSVESAYSNIATAVVN